MLKVFKKRYPNCKLTFNSGSEVLVHMDFADVKPAGGGSDTSEKPPEAAAQNQSDIGA